MRSPFLEQASLMLRTLPHVAAEDCFALKGGTAINFFVRDLPRLSVDIDLTYIPVEPRRDTLVKMGEALVRIKSGIFKAMPGVSIQEGLYEGRVFKLFVRGREAKIKIEPNLIIRGSVHMPVERGLSPKAGEKFRMAVSVKTLSDADLYGGKICAALDRQHPRDLFDIKVLLNNEGITPEIRRAFIVYLVSHGRPMHEVIDPVRKDIRAVFDADFQGMTDEPVEYEALLDARERLIERLKTDISEREKKFILSVKETKPEWELLDLPGIDKLPAIQWKLQNIRKMDAAKHQDYLRKLKDKLDL